MACAYECECLSVCAHMHACRGGGRPAEQSSGLGLAFPHWPGESVRCGRRALLSVVCQWSLVERAHCLQPHPLVRLLLVADELEEEF